MKHTARLSLTTLVLAAACGERSTATAPALTSPVAAAPKPTGPVFDNVGNTLDNTFDAVAEVMPLNVGGAAGTTTLYVSPTNGDGKNGCNLTGNTTLSVSVTSSNPSVATVNASSLTFGSCSEVKTLTVTPLAQGTTTISFRQTANNTGGTFDLSGATFTVNVAPPANTAPTLSIVGVAPGASYTKDGVPAAMCEVRDAEDGNSSFAATLSAISGPYASDGIGEQTASCAYTDRGGLAASASVDYGIVDPSAPTIKSILSPAEADGLDGWYTGQVKLTWAVTEAESPNSLQKTDCADQDVTADQKETSYSCTATSAGGTSGPQSVSIKRDATAPSIAPADVNSTTWRNTALSQAFTATDATSGLANAADASFTLTASDESADASTPTTVSKTVADNAGNASTRTLSALIDRTKPSVGLVGGPAGGSSYDFGSVPAAPTCSASDALSGLDGSCSVTGYSTAVGTHTVTARATDRAGNTNSTTATYTVRPWTLGGFFQPVDMSGVFNTVKAGSTVPLKFTVAAGGVQKTTVDAVRSFTTAVISCSATAPQDEIEITSTGGTSLRYDATAQQFIQNWQTPRTVGCYRTTMTTQDGSTLVALFRTR